MIALRPSRIRRSASAAKQPLEARAQVVARGRALAADPNYPSAELIEQLASMAVEGGLDARPRDSRIR
jgi:2,4-dienoyl-CoA reductase-like NADH-dependent reductase (Old Yellow Enzyme family)